jgi:type I restriction enzyme S subunit
MKNVSKSKLESMTLPLVPFDRQRDFAALYREVHVIEARTAGALQQVEELFASLQSRAFRGDL